MTNKIFLGCDHAGYNLKQQILNLNFEGLEFEDVGTHSTDCVDYPVIAHQVASKVNQDRRNGRGLLICGSGIGMAMVANRYPNVRAVLCRDEDTAYMSRLHNNANVLCMAGRSMDTYGAICIIKMFYSVQFEAGRHVARLFQYNNMV